MCACALYLLFFVVCFVIPFSFIKRDQPLSLFFFFFFWPHTMWLVGFLFPDQGLNLDGKVLTSGLPGNFPR